MQTLSKVELQDYIANNDYDVYIIRKDCKSMADMLRAEGIKFQNIDLVSAVLDLQNDPYIKRMAETLAV